MTTELIESYIVYRKEMALKMSIVVILCLIFLFLSFYVFNSKSLAFIFMCAMVIPIFFLNMIIRLFTRQVFINLRPDSFTIAIKKEGGEQEEALDYTLNEIESYNVQFPNRRFSAIKINSKNGDSKEYSFLNKKRNDGQMETANLVNSFRSMIEEYNEKVSKSERIFFQPSFFASKQGLVWIIILSCFFAAAITLHFYYQAKTSPITLFLGLGLIVQMLLKRKADIDYYKKMM